MCNSNKTFCACKNLGGVFHIPYRTKKNPIQRNCASPLEDSDSPCCLGFFLKSSSRFHFTINHSRLLVKMKRKTCFSSFLFLFFTSFSLFVAGEEIIVITPTWNVTRSQLDGFLSSLMPLKEDIWAWHWGQEADALRWDRQGFINQSEMDYLNSHFGSRGGGFYISFSTSDSRNYGPYPVGMLIRKGTLQLNDENSVSAFTKLGRNPADSKNNDDLVALGTKFAFLDTFTATWSVVHNASLTQKIILAYKLENFDQGLFPLTSEYGDDGSWKAMKSLTERNPSISKEIETMMRHWNLLEFLTPYVSFHHSKF